MYKNKKILGIITARGGSKGLPGKNIRKLNGKPLIAWTIEAGLKSNYVDKLIVSTDDEQIAKISRKFKAEVPFLRPKKLAEDNSSSVDVVLHAINFIEEKGELYDYVILLEPTSPLRTALDIDNAIKKLYSNKSAESIVSVIQAEQYHPSFAFKSKKEFLIPIIKTEGLHKRRQELELIFFPEGTVYISKIESLKKRNSFYHEKTIFYEVERYKALEVDEEMDLVCIEALMKYKKY